MLITKNIEAHDVLLVNDDAGRRAAFIKGGRVIWYNPMISRKHIAEAAKRPLDWSPQNNGRFATAE